ncbi:MAG: hypothetical protein ACPGVG_12400 [Mycobacterium sp.]
MWPSFGDRWRYLAWFDVKRADLWEAVVYVGVMAVLVVACLLVYRG